MFPMFMLESSLMNTLLLKWSSFCKFLIGYPVLVLRLLMGMSASFNQISG